MASLESTTIIPEHEMKLTDHLLYARIRLPMKSDVPFLYKLLHKVATFHKLTGCQITESSLSSILFNSEAPFQSTFNDNVNIFLLEVSSTPFSPHISLSDHFFHPIDKTYHLRYPIDDPEESIFRTEEGTTVVGFVLFFPNYSTFLAKPGFRVEDLLVREAYRSQGFGELLMKAVANLAVKLGYARLEWTVVDWNEGANRFYERICAQILHDYRPAELTDDSLLSCGQLN